MHLRRKESSLKLSPPGSPFETPGKALSNKVCKFKLTQYTLKPFNLFKTNREAQKN